MECRLAGETEVLGENLPQRHFFPSQNPTWPEPGLNPGRRGGKPAINSLSCGAAIFTFNMASLNLRKSLVPWHRSSVSCYVFGKENLELCGIWTFIAMSTIWN
jgi:hypothetical protein